MANSTTFSKSLGRYVLAGLLVSTLSSCSYFRPSRTVDSQRWLADGLINISRPAPAVASLQKNSPSEETLFGFLPSGNKEARKAAVTLPGVVKEPVISGPSLVIDREEASIRLVSSERLIHESAFDVARELKPGTYRVLLLQKEPLWYAPDSYFEKRGLPVPPEGDVERFRRGALGSHAIFIDAETPIHTGPLSTAEVGGIKISEENMVAFYNALEVGAVIEIR